MKMGATIISVHEKSENDVDHIIELLNKWGDLTRLFILVDDVEERAQRDYLPCKRLIINTCRPFDRLKDFPPVNVFSQVRRKEVWEKWKMAEWLPLRDGSISSSPGFANRDAKKARKI